MKFIRSIYLIFLISNILFSQELIGYVHDGSSPVSFVNIMVDYDYESKGILTDLNGLFKLSDLKIGNVNITFSKIGRKTKSISYTIEKGTNNLNVILEEEVYNLDPVVVTGTKTIKRQTESPVIVNIISDEKINNVQAANISEALNFQCGLRVETDCQTCNYTQLRINGLSGSYSQILINGKSIFSPLVGLYGLEQIPSNMIERIEIIKGGGSSLYGSSSIGGVVNLLTRFPESNHFDFGYSFRYFNKQSNDKFIYGNSTVLSKNGNSGVTFYINYRDRDLYDHNGDNFSELSHLNDNTFGGTCFIKHSDNQKIEFNFGSLYEYRYGGEMVIGAPHFALQSEERIHDMLFGNIDYNIEFSDNFSLLAFLAVQKTNREHFTGVRPDIGTDEDVSYLLDPPYGTSLNSTKQFGFQLNYEYSGLIGKNNFTIGSEILSDDVLDEIPAYNYIVDQNVHALGLLFQSDWIFNEQLSLLSGFRIDNHSLLRYKIISPRFSFLFNFQNNTQLRLSYSTGFRAPQAFDTDLHIAFAGGGVSRIELADNLKEEKSNSFSGSLNYDYVKENFIYGFTLEGFYTKLQDAFYLEPDGVDSFGNLFVKTNGPGALVKGLSIDLRLNYNRNLQFESGLTIQSSNYDRPVTYSEILIPKSNFLKSPNSYGYANLTYKIGSKISSSLSYIYTGRMELIHLGGSFSNEYDKYVQSSVFNQFDIHFNYSQFLNKTGIELTYSIGVKNITNSYQSDFDLFQNRDSNYIYGPSNPRMFMMGLKVSSL